MPSPSRRAASPIALACALALCGCGVSGQKSPSRDALFVSRADAVCTKAKQRASGLSRLESLSQLERFDSILPQAERELRAVRAPARQRAAYATFLAAVSTEAQRVGRLVEALRERDQALFRKRA